jgi:cation/acetate symporter
MELESQTIWTFAFVVISFGIYMGIAIWSRAGSTGDFYVAGGGVHPAANGAATAADWMSAASFLSMAGLVAFNGYSASVYLLGWTGGYVLLALMLAPYLRKFGKFTVPDFIGDRYYSQAARIVAVFCLIAISYTYIAGQMRGVGVVFSNFLEIPINAGVIVGALIVLFYATLGGMKGITYTQVAQYCVMIFAYTVPAVFISLQIAGNPIPQLGFLGEYLDSGQSVVTKLDNVLVQLGFSEYTEVDANILNTFCIAVALMVGTAGLPHVIVRFFTVPKVRDARISAGYALLFIAALYTTAPAVASFARLNFIETVNGEDFRSGVPYEQAPEWFTKYEGIGLIAWADKNGDGLMQYRAGTLTEGGEDPQYAGEEGQYGQEVITNELSDSPNEVYVDQDIMVLANPEIADLPEWVIALVVAGGIAAALSTAAGLLLVISAAFSHDLGKKWLLPNMGDRTELVIARTSMVIAVIIATLFGIFPPGFVAQTVALAFGLAASSLFPAILMGIFFKRINRAGAVTGMIVGLAFTLAYIIYYAVLDNPAGLPFLFGISERGIGTVAMLANFAVAFIISYATAAPPKDVQDIVTKIRSPMGVTAATAH